MHISEQFRDDSLRSIAQRGGAILDVGGGKPFTKWMKAYEPLFATLDYRTLDNDASTNPTIVGDIHALPLADASVDSIICASVLEHVTDPAQAVREMRRILKPGGALFLTVPSTYPYHIRKGQYLDYWRFFDSTLEYLFSDWASLKLVKTGGLFGAWVFFVPFQSKLMPVLRPLSRFLDAATGMNARATTPGYMAYLLK